MEGDYALEFPPRSNVFLRGRVPEQKTDTNYQTDYNDGKFSMSAHGETLKAVEDRRISASLPVTKVNIFPGHKSGTLSSSSYDMAFNKDSTPAKELDKNTGPNSKGHCHLKPSCTHCMYEAILDSHHFRERPRANKTENAGKVDPFSSLRGTHVTLGNDKIKPATAYKDLTDSTLSFSERAKMVSPPVEAEVGNSDKDRTRQFTFNELYLPSTLV